MSDWKQMLRERAAAKRAKVTLLKDVPPEGLQIGCDYVEEHLELSPAIEPGGVVRYLRRASAAQVAALQARIPWVVKEVWAYNSRGRRPVVCFATRFIYEVLKFAVNDPSKYLGDAAWVRPEELEVTVVQSAYSKVNTACRRIVMEHPDDISQAGRGW